MSLYPTSLLDRRKDLMLRTIVEKAISIGEQTGFIDAADFMYQAKIPQEIALRVLINLCRTAH